ncbi:MAG: alpha-mannosyltransferase [Rickettsiales bacterium]|nr:alpha-mannosyltransferase [Rickettsiales bacterium]
MLNSNKISTIQKLIIATDAWSPQVNGVVRTYERLVQELINKGIDVCVIEPSQFTTFPLPGYSEIKLSLVLSNYIDKVVKDKKPDHIHIATEGPIGLAMRRYCLRNDISFTTSFHTKFPEYIEARTLIPSHISYYLLKRFHNAARSVLVSTNSLMKTLQAKGFKNIKLWPKAVDTKIFRPKIIDKRQFILPHVKGKNLELSNKVLLYVGRVAVEKNIESFLSLKTKALKVVVGEGPQRAELEKKFPETLFVGQKTGEDLVDWYNIADVFVFPSTTDTYGNVILEALACNLPVAGYPVTGPIDILEQNVTGCMNWDLNVAVEEALRIKSEACKKAVENSTWDSVSNAFLELVTNIKYESQQK